MAFKPTINRQYLPYLKKLIAALSIILLVSSFTIDGVYICKSKTASVYHSSETCKGLKGCTHEVIKVTKTDAVEKYGRRACKICY